MTQIKQELSPTQEGLVVGGHFHIEHVRDGKVINKEVIPNIVVNEGLNYLLDAGLSVGTQSSNFYVGIFSNNYTPIASDVMSTFAGAGVANEVVTEIVEAARPGWVEVGVSAQTIGNAASPAVFTADGTVSVYGAFLSSDSTLGGTNGTLIAAGKFATVRNLIATDVLNVTYVISATST